MNDFFEYTSGIMDLTQLAEILAAVLDYKQRKEAEKKLSQMQELIGFSPSLLQVAMHHEIPGPVRLMGAVVLKNFISSRWQEKEPQEGEITPSIHEQDRTTMKNIIVEAIVHAPEINTIREILCVCLYNIIKYDFPDRWTQIVDKIHSFLHNQEVHSLMGALLCLRQLLKNYEINLTDYKRAHLLEAMRLFLPRMYQIMVNLQADLSIESVLVQKQILKCFHGLIHFDLPLELLPKEVFTNWMQVFCLVMESPVPDDTPEVDVDDRMELPWWKYKKWAVHILYSIFQSYGSSVLASEEYVQFAEWHLTTFSGGVLQVLFQFLDIYRNKGYVSPKVLQFSLRYIELGVIHSLSWKLVKPHMFAVIKDVLYPLMSSSQSDEDLWEGDPYEYIRLKFDVYQNYYSPVSAARELLSTICNKRKGLLEPTMHFCIQILANQNGEYDSRQRDGALHMVGALNNSLKKYYKDDMDTLLSQYVFPEFCSPIAYIRARACWVLQCFAGIHFKSEPLLIEALRLTTSALLNDTDMPVKLEAVVTLQALLLWQEKVQIYLEVQIKEITLELIRIICETDNDNAINILRKIIPLYLNQLLPVAYDITVHLETAFSKIIGTDSGTGNQGFTAEGLLTTMKTTLIIVGNYPETTPQLEMTVLRIVNHIIHHNTEEYYEEAMNALQTLTAKKISEDMWKMLEVLCQVFQKNGLHSLTDMVLVLHNYITVDTDAFLSNENRIVTIFNMAKAVLNSENIENMTKYNAVKLLRVIVLQCSGKIDHYIPIFVELVLNRIATEVNRVKGSTPQNALRIMLLQVLIAILCINPPLLFITLEKLQGLMPNKSNTHYFIKQWIQDMEYFVGKNGMKLCILGICTLLGLGPQRPNIDEFVPILLPSCLFVFERLNKAYKLGDRDDSDASLKDGSDDTGEEVMLRDEEDLDLMALPGAAKHDTASIFEEHDDSEDDYDDWLLPTEYYKTPFGESYIKIDEYIKFEDTFTELSEKEPLLYHALTSGLTEHQQGQLGALLLLANQHRTQQASELGG